MSARFLASVGVSAALVAMLALVEAEPVAGQAPPATKKAAAARDWKQSRTLWGDPDLQGVWTSNDMWFVPMERPPEFGDRKLLTEEEWAARHKEAKAQNEGTNQRSAGDPGAGPTHWYERAPGTSWQTSLVVEPPDGRIPWTPKGLEANRARQAVMRRPPASWLDANLWDRCITRGLPSVMIPTSYNNAYQIVQTPGYVTIRYEMLAYRVIPLDGRPHVDSRIRMWEGDSRGHWEGNTLVVDVTNFSDKTNGNLRAYGSYAGNGETLHLVERFTRVDADTVNYEATLEDPVAYTRPWTVAIPLRSDPDYRMFEYACHEGNYAMANRLSGARADEKKAAEDAAKNAGKESSGR